MCIISFFKRRFSKNLLPSSDLKKHLVYVSKSKKDKVWFDKKIVVPEDFMLYFGYKGKVLDEFPTGTHQAQHIYLSKTIRALKLNKKSKKKGGSPKWFCADAYYVNLMQFPAKKWSLFARAELFDEKLGYFKAMLSGEYIFKVERPKLFLNWLLSLYDYLMQYEAFELLDGRISEFVFNLLMKQDFNFKQINDKEMLTDLLFEKVNINLKKIGVELLGFSVNEVKVAKRVLRRANQVYFDTLLEQEQMPEVVAGQTEFGFENDLLTESNEDEFLLSGVKGEVGQGSNDSTNNQNEQVDFNTSNFLVNESVNERQSFKICEFCKEKNSTQSLYCGLCGEKLK